MPFQRMLRASILETWYMVQAVYNNPEQNLKGNPGVITVNTP